MKEHGLEPKYQTGHSTLQTATLIKQALQQRSSLNINDKGRPWQRQMDKK